MEVAEGQQVVLLDGARGHPAQLRPVGRRGQVGELHHEGVARGVFQDPLHLFGQLIFAAQVEHGDPPLDLLVQGRVLVMQPLEGRAHHLLHGLQVVVHALLIHEGQGRQGPEVELLVRVHAEGQESPGLGHEARLLEQRIGIAIAVHLQHRVR